MGTLIWCFSSLSYYSASLGHAILLFLPPSIKGCIHTKYSGTSAIVQIPIIQLLLVQIRAMVPYNWGPTVLLAIIIITIIWNMIWLYGMQQVATTITVLKRLWGSTIKIGAEITIGQVIGQVIESSAPFILYSEVKVWPFIGWTLFQSVLYRMSSTGFPPINNSIQSNTFKNAAAVHDPADLYKIQILRWCIIIDQSC